MHRRYLWYLARHKWFVLIAGLRTGTPLWRLLIHDWSKFRPGEWVPYAEFFYGDGHDRERKSAAFDRAWLAHQHRNPHHWQHWILREDSGATKVLPMPGHFVREMIADWMGAGRAIRGNRDMWLETARWYVRNRDHIELHPETRAIVENMLSLIPIGQAAS